jgi:transposase InsO family protein
VPVPAAPATVGAYLASLAATHAPTTIRRRLSAIGKMHRFNDLAWNPAHRDIQGPLQGALRTHGRPVQKAAALSLAMLRPILLTCDQTARGRRDRGLLLFGFVGALRRSELVALRVEDVVVVAGGLRLRILRGKTDQAGQGAEIGLPRGRYVETCPVRAFEAWQAVARRKAGPLFRRISTGDGIGAAALHPDAVRHILANRVQMAGISVDGFDRLSAHALRVALALDCHDREVVGWVAATAGISGEMIRDLMVECVGRRFGTVRAPHSVQWLADNGSVNAAAKTLDIAIALNLEPCFTPVESPESNGVAEALVKTFERDYVRVSAIPDAATALATVDDWINDYNEVHPHRRLAYRSPREYIRDQSQPAACPV